MGNLENFIVIAIIVVGAGLLFWSRRRKQMYTAAVMPQGMSQKELAHNAFVQGNTYLAQGEFAQATAAFQQAIELDPKHPHVADRLAAVAQRQHTADIVVSSAATR